MAPLATEPDHLRVVLNPARRKAYFALVTEIAAYMRSQLELREDETATHNTTSPSATTTTTTSTEQQQQQQQHRPTQSPALRRLRRAALSHFDSWRTETLGRLREVAAKADDAKVVDARKQRAERLAAQAATAAAAAADKGEDLLSFEEDGGDVGQKKSEAPSSPRQGSGGPDGEARATPLLAAFQTLYHPIPTRLTTVPEADRREVVSATLLVLLAGGSYAAYSRALALYLASALGLPATLVDGEEAQIASTMMKSVAKAEEAEKKKAATGMSADAEAEKRRQEGQAGRLWKVGLASVAGAAVIGITGGLAAPVIAGAVGGLMGSVGLGGLASFLGVFWMNGALVGTLFGAFGARMTGEAVDSYAREVEDFKFLPLRPGGEWGEQYRRAADDEARRLRVTIGINGWLTSEADVTRPWRALGDESESFALRFEMKSLLALGQGLRDAVSSYAWAAIKTEILKRTVLATLWSALWPMNLVALASNLDNPFTLAKNRSEKAGQILADALINKVQGERPVTLIGYSLGARVIYSCLRTLADRRAFGLVDTVVLIGAPVPSNPNHWEMMHTVVAGKMFNVYSENDYILAFLYRSTSMQLGIAGLQSIHEEVEGVENLDLSNEVEGHLRYPSLIPQILTRCSFPNVKGGTGAIEKEEAIQLSDKDFAESGHLVDIDEPETEAGEPSKTRRREQENEKFDPSVKNVREQKSDASVRQDRIRSSPALEKVGGQLDTAPVSRSASSPLASRPGQTEPVHWSTQMAGGSDGVGSDGGDDSDEEEMIRMMDHEGDSDDGELQRYTEPLAIEDDGAAERPDMSRG